MWDYGFLTAPAGLLVTYSFGLYVWNVGSAAMRRVGT